MIGIGNKNLDKYLLKSEAKTEYVPKGDFDIDIEGIDSSINSLNSDISSLKVYTESIETLLTSLTNNTAYFNNELYSIKTNTESMSGIIEELTTRNFNYDYWEQFNKNANETYINFDLNSTVVKYEELTFNQHLDYRVSNSGKPEYVLNSNILDTIFTIEQPLSRLGLKLNSSCSPLRATASTIDIAAYQNITLNDSFNLKCQSLNLINSGGNVNNLNSNIWASTIKFINFNSMSEYSFNLNPNVLYLENLPNNLTLNLTNNNNINRYSFSQSGYNIKINNSDTFNNCIFDNIVIISCYNLNDFVLSSCIFESNVLLNPSDVGYYTVVNNNFKNVVTNNNTCNKFLFSGNTIQKITGNNYYGHATCMYSNNSMTSFSFNNPGYIDLGNNIISSISINGNLNAQQFTFSNNTCDQVKLTFINVGDYSFTNNTLTTMGISATNGTFQNFNKLSNLQRLSFSGSDYEVIGAYNITQPNALLTINITNGTAIDCTYPAVSISQNLELNNCSFSSASFNAQQYSNPQKWMGVTMDNVEIWNFSTNFYNYMLSVDNGLYDVHIPNFWRGVEDNFQIATNTINYAAEVLVKNPITTSVNLMIPPNTDRRIDCQFIKSQESIQKIDFRGWLPSQVVNFDQYFLFDNVASGILDTDVKFTMIVDAVSDWSNYINFLNPFGDNNPNRIRIIEY